MKWDKDWFMNFGSSALGGAVGQILAYILLAILPILIAWYFQNLQIVFIIVLAFLALIELILLFRMYRQVKEVEKAKEAIAKEAKETKEAKEALEAKLAKETNECNPLRIHLKHRDVTKDFFENQAFQCGTEMYYLSIMSEHTLTDMEARLRRAQETGTHVRVMTFDPSVHKAVAEAICLHFREFPRGLEDTREQIRKASALWSALADKYHDTMTLRRYNSIPTLQAVLIFNLKISIELMPYDTRPDDRPGLFLTRKDDEALFNLFQEKILALWNCPQVGKE